MTHPAYAAALPTDPTGTISRRTLLRLAAALGGAGALGVSVTGCATPTGLPGPETLNIGLNRSLVSLDNKLNQFDAAVTVQRGVRQGLTRIGPDLRPKLVLAESFQLTAPTQWTVRFRQGIRYSDNSPVQIKDVATALAMYRDTKGGFLATFFPEWPRVVPVDARTFRLETDAPLPILDYLMANILITPAAANKPEELQGGVGTGPYIVASADRGSGNYLLRSNPHYWAAKPSVETVQVRFLPEESSRVVSLRSGEIDVIDTISPDSVEQLRGLPGVDIQTAGGTRLTHLFYNFRKPKTHPLADPQVREALSYAINGESLISDILVGSVIQADGVVPPELAGATKTGEYRYDPDKAKHMLDALGVRDLGIKIIWESGEFASDTQVMEAIYEMLRAVGVKPTLQQFQPGGDISTWRQGKAGEWDVLGNGYGSPTGLAVTMLQGMYAGTAKKEETRDTYHGYIFPKITEQIARASAEIDPKKRQLVLAQVQRDIWNTWPAIWAFAPKSVVARRKRVDGLLLGANNSYDLTAVRLEA
jgi:peptide/nickel transport system substrate-binding protein